jgi:flagellar basal body rod protein FlgG
MHATGNPTDFAIDGDAFFKVRENNGDIAYTRNGQFRLNANGVLVTGDGAQVLMSNDVPLNLGPKDGNLISISPDGKVKVGPTGKSRGSLAVVHMDDPRTVLMQGAAGRFRQANPDDGSQIQSGLGKNSLIRQGYLEEGNANPVTSMISLVQVVRSYEANQKSVTMQDSVTSEMIQAAADTSSSS